MRGTRLALGVTAVAVLIAGCDRGGDDDARRGPKTLVVLAGADVDSVDPGGTSLAAVHNLLSNVHRALYAPRPGAGLRPQPDLATGPPRVSADGRTATFTIRRGVRFAPPVNREVVAADIEYGLERLFLPSVQNSMALELLGNVAGVREAVKGRRGDIPGIEAPDDRTLVLRFVDGSGTAEPPLLMLPLGVPVPREYAQRFDGGRRSTYYRHQVATGPYRLEADAGGRVTARGFTPARGIRLVRNPSWDRRSDHRPAPLDVIDYRTGNENAPAAVRRILGGRGMAASLLLVPPGLVRGMNPDERADRFFQPAEDAVGFMTLNTSEPPFDDVRVRRMVQRGIDRGAVVQAMGGPFFALPAAHVIPPAVAGHAESDALIAQVDAVPPPAADVLEGLSEKDRRVRMVSPRRWAKLSEVVQAELTRLGFEVEVTPIADAALTTICGDRRRAGDLCLLGITYGIHDPAPIVALLASSTGPFNFSFLRSRAIDDAIGRANLAAGRARPAAWAEVNRLIVQEAGIVPLSWPRRPIAHSSDVRARGVSDIDYAYTDLE